MRAIVAGLISGVTLTLVGAAPARAQYSRPSDPCAPQAQSVGMFSGSASGMPGALSAVIGLIGQHSRDQACAEERRAQWDEYNARQKAAKKAADAAAAKAQEQQADASPDKAATAEPAPPVVHVQRQHAAVQARRVRAQRLTTAGQEGRIAQERRQLGAIMLAQAENAPDHCRAPELARSVMDAWNGLDAMKAAGMKAIDIEQLATVSFDADSHAVACHGVFVTDGGARIAGTATVKRNVAGDPIFVWERDGTRDASAYTAAPSTDSPGSSHAVHVEQASSTAALPVLSNPATLSLTAAQR